MALVALTTATAEDAPCPAVTFGHSWGNGRNGEIKFESPEQMRGWKVTLTFDKPVSHIHPHKGKDGRCDGKVCTFSARNFNKNKEVGEEIYVDFGINFDHRSGKPSLVSAAINNQKFHNSEDIDLCALPAPEEPTTTTPTPGDEAPTTTGLPTTTLPEEDKCYEIDNAWGNGLTAKLLLKSDTLLKNFKVEVTFDNDFTDFNVYNGKDKSCDGRTCEFSSRQWAKVRPNQVKKMGFGLQFNGAKPDIISVKLNGVELCGASTTVAPTEEPETPTEEPETPTEEPETPTEEPETPTEEPETPTEEPETPTEEPETPTEEPETPTE